MLRGAKVTHTSSEKLQSERSALHWFVMRPNCSNGSKRTPSSSVAGNMTKIGGVLLHGLKLGKLVSKILDHAPPSERWATFRDVQQSRDTARSGPSGSTNVDQNSALEKRLYICTPLFARLICRSAPADLCEEIFCTARNSYRSIIKLFSILLFLRGSRIQRAKNEAREVPKCRLVH